MEQSLSAQLDKLKVNADGNAEPTFADLEKSFFSARKPSWSASSIKQYNRWAESMRTFFRPGTSLSKITITRVEQFKNWLLAQNYSSNTVIHRLEFASTMWSWAMKMEWTIRNPFKHVDRPKRIPKRMVDPFSPAEIHKILSTAQSDFLWLYPCILTAALTGCRRGALRMLDVRDWDSSGKRLMLRSEIAKQGVGHVYAVPDILARVLDGIVEGRPADAPLFYTRLGRRLSHKTLDSHAGATQSPNAWRQILDKAGVRPRGIHQLRSAVDSNLVMAGVPIDLAIAVTGHSKDVARDHYLRVHLDSQRKTIDKLVDLYGVESAQDHLDGEPASSRKLKADNVSECLDGGPAEDKGLANLKVDKQDLCVLWEALSLLEQSFLCQNSGTIFWHKPFLRFADDSKQGSYKELAERGGFEPPVRLYTVRRFSKPLPSATRPPLHQVWVSRCAGPGHRWMMRAGRCAGNRF